jgi:hypothetical protein
MPDMDKIRAAVDDIVARIDELADAADGLAVEVVDDTPPPAPAPGLRTTEITSSRVTVEWSTTRTDVRSWTIGRGGIDQSGYPDWSTTLPAAVRVFTFGSLRPGTAYPLTLTPDTGPGTTITVTTSPSTPPPPPPPPPPNPGAQHGPRALADNWPPLEVTRDDFPGPAVDLTKWALYNSVGHGGRGLRRPGQFSIVADPTALGGTALQVDGTTDGTTGGMANRRPLRFGRWAARVKVPAPAPGAPAWDPRYHTVCLTWPDRENWMTGGGEIDWSEGKCSVNHVEFFLHFSTSGGRSDQQTSRGIDVDVTQWHWWEVEWCRDHVRGWCDGQLWFEDLDQRHFNYDAFGPHHGCIQLDWFPGDGVNVTGPGRMLVDAWRVYRHPDTVTA